MNGKLLSKAKDIKVKVISETNEIYVYCEYIFDSVILDTYGKIFDFSYEISMDYDNKIIIKCKDMIDTEVAIRAFNEMICLTCNLISKKEYDKYTELFINNYLFRKRLDNTYVLVYKDDKGLLHESKFINLKESELKEYKHTIAELKRKSHSSLKDRISKKDYRFKELLENQLLLTKIEDTYYVSFCLEYANISMKMELDKLLKENNLQYTVFYGDSYDDIMIELNSLEDLDKVYKIKDQIDDLYSGYKKEEEVKYNFMEDYNDISNPYSVIILEKDDYEIAKIRFLNKKKELKFRNLVYSEGLLDLDEDENIIVYDMNDIYTIFRLLREVHR